MSKGRYSADSSQKPVVSRRRIVVAVICAAVLVLGAGAFFLVRALLDPYDCRIVPNVTVAGLDVSGMTKVEARKALQTALNETLYNHDLEVALPMESIFFSPADTGVQVNIREAVDAAYRVGRSDDGLPTTACDIDLSPCLRVNTDFIRSELKDYADRYDTEFRESHYALSGDAPSLSTENHDPNAPCQTLNLTVGIPKARLDVDDTCDRVIGAYGHAVAACSAGEYCVRVEIPSDSIPAELDLTAIYDEVCTAPVDDSLDMTAYRFVPGTYGYQFDLESAKAALAQAKPGETVSIPMEYVEPEILGDEVYFRDVLGSCETKHGDNENRNTNLRLLCEALNGVVLQPGEVFSYNETLGERTAEKGYKPAPAYSGNRLTDAIGGGVCQGSSTLYNCVLLADLEVISRTCHGATVAYLPLGLDAAVNWGTTDFQFRNNFHFPIKIEAETTEDLVKMRILGTDEKDYYIVMTSGYDDSREGVIYAVSYKNKYNKETGELISKDREAFSTYYRDIG
ncbi:MAG: VanW family protein [Faecousia sp.]